MLVRARVRACVHVCACVCVYARACMCACALRAITSDVFQNQPAGHERSCCEAVWRTGAGLVEWHIKEHCALEIPSELLLLDKLPYLL